MVTGLRNGSPWRLVAGSTFVIFGIDHKASSHALAFTLRVQVGFIAQSQVDNASLPRRHRRELVGGSSLADFFGGHSCSHASLLQSNGTLVLAIEADFFALAG